MNALTTFIAHEISAPPPEIVAHCAAALRRQFGPATAAVLFYGAGLRDSRPDALLDFYVLVDDLAAALPNALARLGALVLPPNVYSVSVPTDLGVARCKVAVMTLDAFARGMTHFTPHLWARFAQAVSAAYLRDDRTRAVVTAALSRAVRKTIRATLPLMPAQFDAQALWTRAFAESYAAELRPEAGRRIEEIVAAGSARYEALTRAVLGPAPADGRFRRQAGTEFPATLAWMLRRPWGKLLNALRLMKAAFTFEGGLDYAVAKIARHSGVNVTVRTADRRVPLLGGIRIFVEAWRRGGVR